MGQQTAVEWFADEILKAAIVFLYNEKNEGKFSLAYDELLEQAKQIDKEQKIEFAKQCLNKALDTDIRTAYKKVEQYYNETYGTTNGS